MTPQECKDKVAQRMGFSNWKRFELFVKPTSAIIDEVSKLYASEKVKEALKVAATSALASFHKGYITGLATDSILSLESELINQINQEI